MSKLKTDIAEKRFLVRLCDLVITVTTALAFAVVPAFFTGLVAQGFVFEKMVLLYLLVLIALVAWITKGVAQGELALIRTPLDVPIAGVGIVLLVSSIFSVDPLSSFVGSFGATAKTAIAFFVYATFYYIIVNTVTRRRILAYGVALAAGIVAVIAYAALQLSGIFILPVELTRTPSFNPIGSSSSLGVFIAAALPFLGVLLPGLFGAEKSSWAQKTGAVALRVATVLSIAGGFFILFLLNDFVVWWIAVLGAVIVLMFILSGIVSLPSRDTVAPVVIFFLLMILLVGGNFNLVQAQLPAEVSLTRGLSWNIAKESLKRDPLFGSGPATFDYSFVRYRGSDFNASNLWNVRFDASNGSLFELLATVGVLGAFGFTAIGLIVISVVFISLTKSKEKEIKTLLLGAFAALVILTVNALFAAVSGSIILAIVLFGTYTMGLVVMSYPEKFKEFNLSFRSSPKYALALSSLFLLVSAGVVVLFTTGFKVYLADMFALKAASAEDEAAVEYLQRAIATTDYQDQYYLRLARLYMGMANTEIARGEGVDVQKVQNYISLAIAAGKRAVELAPNSVVNKETLALIYENAAAYNIGGALQWAEKYYADVIALEPDNPTAYLRLALINMAYAAGEEAAEEQQHFYNEALKFYDQAIAKKSNLGAAYYGKGIVSERLGNYDAAIESVGQAVAVAPTNLDYRYELGRLYFNRGVANKDLQQAPATPVAEAGAESEAEELDADPAATPPATGSTAADLKNNSDVQTAEALFKTVVQASPSHANAVYSLALIYEVTGDKGQARTYYEKLVEIVPDQETKDAILQKLSTL